MAPNRKRTLTIIYWTETAVWLIITFMGRDYFDRAAVGLSPVWLVWVLRLTLLLVIVGVAVLVHLLLQRYLKARGIIE